MDILRQKIKFYGRTPPTNCHISKSQLMQGIKVEHEHTKDNKVAKAIATAHLCEFPTYYTALSKMENSLKKKK